MTLRPALLWGAAAVAWGIEIWADVANLPPHFWATTLGVALVLTMAAVQCVAITRRLDRMYQALLLAAAMTPPTPEAVPVPAQCSRLSLVASTGPQPRL